MRTVGQSTIGASHSWELLAPGAPPKGSPAQNQIFSLPAHLLSGEWASSDEAPVCRQRSSAPVGAHHWGQDQNQDVALVRCPGPPACPGAPPLLGPGSGQSKLAGARWPPKLWPALCLRLRVGWWCRWHQVTTIIELTIDDGHHDASCVRVQGWAGIASPGGVATMMEQGSHW